MQKNSPAFFPPDEPQDYAIWAIGLGIVLFLAYKAFGGIEPEPPGPEPKQKYDLTVKSVGPGIITVIINGKGKGTVDHNEKKFSKINYGTPILLEPRPDEGAILESIDKKSFTIKSNTTATAYFKEKTTEGKHPYGLSDRKWGTLKPGIKKLLENKNCLNIGSDAPVVFGFKKWFNDKRLIFSGHLNCSEYCQKVANVISLGAPDPIINVHKTGWLGLAEKMNYSELMEHIRKLSG